MPNISVEADRGLWCPSVGGLPGFIQKTAARMIGYCFILIICGCATATTPPAPDGHRVLSKKSTAALAFPSKGPSGATVTLTVFEDYQ